MIFSIAYSTFLIVQILTRMTILCEKVPAGKVNDILRTGNHPLEPHTVLSVE